LGAIAYLVLGKDHHDRHSSLPHDESREFGDAVR
jgi:hypothetical protein